MCNEDRDEKFWDGGFWDGGPWVSRQVRVPSDFDSISNNLVKAIKCLRAATYVPRRKSQHRRQKDNRIWLEFAMGDRGTIHYRVRIGSKHAWTVHLGTENNRECAYCHTGRKIIRKSNWKPVSSGRQFMLAKACKTIIRCTLSATIY